MSASVIPTSFFRALRFQDPDVDALRKITDPEWERILRTWSTARIMTSYRLDHRDQGSDVLPRWVGHQIDQYLDDINLRFQEFKSTYSSLATELEAVGADYVVIKGFSLFPGFTASAGSRPQGDIDLLCSPDSANLAQQVLLGLGYSPVVRNVESYEDQLSTMMPKTSWKPNPRLFDPEMPISVEVHFRLWDEGYMRLPMPGVEEFWSRRTTRQIDDLTFPGLHLVDNLGCSTIHILRELLQGLPTIEQVHSVARFLHTQSDNDEFWRQWQELHEPSLRRREVIAFQLAVDWFGCKVSPQVQEEISRLPSGIQAWFSHATRQAHYPRLRDGKAGAWLQFLLLESFPDRMNVLRRVIFKSDFGQN